MDLQWGRNMIVAEGCTFVKCKPRYRPSMGPQHDSCGRDKAGPAMAALRTHLQWGRNMIVAEGARGYAAHSYARLPSMGPQHDSCGRVNGFVLGPAREYLQWGRNMIVAEGPS